MIVAPFMQLHNPAPTLPIHSPHSPMHLKSYSKIQPSKLSGRYINNKIFQQKSANKLLSGKQMTEKNIYFNERERATITHSNKICGCIKSPKHEMIESCATNFTVEEQKSDLSKATYDNRPKRKEKSTVDFKLKKKNEVASDVNSKHRRSLGVQDNHNICQYTLKTSRSEQSSPNIVNINKSNFAYDSLLHVSAMDPWIKKNELLMYSLNTVDKNSTDPWIKLPSSDHVTTGSSTEKSQKPDFILETKTKSYLKPVLLQKKMSRNQELVFSAPPSPNLNNSSNCTTNLSQKKKLPIKSASFSPARFKPFVNPFEDSLYGSIATLSFQPNYVATPNQLEYTENVNCNLLNVNTSNKEELQLNIRGLSEHLSQMNVVQFSLGDCNVNIKEYGTQTFVEKAQTYEFPAAQIELPKAEKKGYKEIVKCKESFHSVKHNSNFSSVSGKTKVYINHQKPNPMPETTC
ncbi:uncharacterized protein LOC135427268 isoform X1 [Drosophila montana]|uniref:uncharacterized protein LOC135427268 isoform X1 n=1 Tax=Drosophila montana TaxID=40370 RepID=UPI00313B1B03